MRITASFSLILFLAYDVALAVRDILRGADCDGDGEITAEEYEEKYGSTEGGTFRQGFSELDHDGAALCPL